MVSRFAALDSDERGGSPCVEHHARVRLAAMLVMTVRSEIPVTTPTVDFGFVTRMDIVITRRDSPDKVEESVGQMRMARIHIADAMNRGVAIADVLDADSGALADLYDVFFDDDTYLKSEFQNGFDHDVLYAEELLVRPEWSERRVDQAVIRRLADTWGEGCAIIVVPLDRADAVERWREAGFEVAREPRPDRQGYVFIDLAQEQPDLIPCDENGHAFEVAHSDS